MKRHPSSIGAEFICTPVLVAAAVAVAFVSGGRIAAAAPASVLGVPCDKIYELEIDSQENMRAGLIRIGCGLEAAGDPDLFETTPGVDGIVKGFNVNVITGAETYPKVTQSESMVWASPDGSTIVVNYNDSSTAPGNYSGVSVSTDGGLTFTRLLPAPFATGHGTNYGDPVVVYNAALGAWFAGDLVTGCGSLGIGLWTSTDALNWTLGACAHNGGDDRESMWVDNNPNSPYFGRMYLSWNQGRIYETHSDDGVSWSSALVISPVSSNVIRNIQLTGSPEDGTVFIVAMDEGLGGGLSNRQNILYRSTDGGDSWTQVLIGSPFAPPGQAGCGYFARIPPIWRHMGWGQPGVGPNGVVHYAYAGRGMNTGDMGDIYYTRSLDNGDTWSPPIVLNSDALMGGTQAQWMPSLSVTPNGQVLVTWYDRRNTTDGNNYEYWGIQSADNGETWGPDLPISNTLIDQPEQPDGSFVGCYAGDYNYQVSNETTSFVTWTDGRVHVSGHPQQDVFFAAVGVPVGGLVIGEVRSDADGSPIAGAKVRAVGVLERVATSDANGSYYVRLLGGVYSVTASADGFVPADLGKVEVVEGNLIPLYITLTPKTFSP